LPDLAPSDFFLFPKLKMKLKGRKFQMVEEIQAESQAVLNTLQENYFQECFKNWQRCWDHCQASEGTTLKVMLASNVQGKPFCVLSHQSGNL
jgi:hypothetical protein